VLFETVTDAIENADPDEQLVCFWVQPFALGDVRSGRGRRGSENGK
jgi:hypothetical protein